MEAFGFGVQGVVLKAHQGALRCVTTFYIVVGDRFMGAFFGLAGFCNLSCKFHTFHASHVCFIWG